MASYLVSLLMGLAVGMAYGLVHVRSPAPPAIALLGLLGMLVGEYGAILVLRHFGDPRSQVPAAQTQTLMSRCYLGPAGSSVGPITTPRLTTSGVQEALKKPCRSSG
jgi:XapX domain-containing protein